MNISTTRFTAIPLMILINLCLAIGCASNQPIPVVKAPKATMAAKPKHVTPPVKQVPPPPSKPEFLEHTVRWKGESLSHIAHWYTGAARNWKKIARVNPSLKEHRIFIGNLILIPKDLLMRRKQMPREFVEATSSTPLESKKSRLEVPQKKEVVETNLFEPIDPAEKTTEQPSKDSPDDIELFEPVQGSQ